MNDEHNKLSQEKQDQTKINHYLIPSRKRLYQSPYNFVLLGISGGIAEHINVHPMLIRGLFIITTLLGGWGIVAYLICAFLIPVHPSDKSKGRFGKITSTKLLGITMISVGVYYWLPTFGMFRFISSINFESNFVMAIVTLFAGLYFLLFPIKIPSHTENPKRFFRAKENRRLLGVCQGLSFYTGVNVNMIRMSCVLLTFITLGTTAVLYFALGYFIPNEPVEDISA